ncbi:tyrosine-type recombinase/integrase [Parafrankia sp. FMc2]|uniref:tyrosine-type recombinase/integrase n=1 Tax=Parafrankia sp. FMc2 TaxID=3233196 RepID=UPI0034D60E54
MARIKDRWFNAKKGPDGERVKSARHGKGDRWQVEYLDDAGKPHYPTFAKRVDAERFLSTVEADKLRGTYVDPDKGKELFRARAEAWQRDQVQHAPSTAETVASDLKNHIISTFGDRPIGKIRRSAVQSWVTERSAVLAPRTMHRVYGYLATIFRSAVADGIITATPCLNINLPPITKTRVVPLPTMAVEALVEAAPARWRAAFVEAAGTGKREGEILGSTLDRVEFLHRRGRVDRQGQTPNRGKPYLRPLKTEASERTIPYPQVVITALSEHVRQFPPALVEVDEYTERAAGATPRRVQVRLLYPGDDGGIIRRNRFIDRVWKPAVRQAEAALRKRAADLRKVRQKDEADKVDAVADRLAAGVDFHEMRHYYASLLIFAGENVKVVQARLGHKSAMETLDTYGHLWPDTEDATRTAVDAVLGTALQTETAQERPSVGA